jgi:hypothetical protein
MANSGSKRPAAICVSVNLLSSCAGIFGPVQRTYRGLRWAQRGIREDVIMTDEKMDLPIANRSGGLNRSARPADFGTSIAAIIAITKSEWMAQEQTSSAVNEMQARRFPHTAYGTTER